MTFLLGDDAREEAKRSLRGLIGHVAKSHGPAHHEPIYLVINTHTPLIKRKDFTPRVVPVTYPLRQIDEKKILLISRDSHYRELLQKKGAATEDLFHDIIQFKKIKSMSGNRQSLVRLAKENDLVLADSRIHSKLVDILGAPFYSKNKRVPYMIQMAPWTTHRLHASSGLEHRLDEKYVRKQVKSILANTSVLPTTGNCVHVVVGYSDWKLSHVLANINDVVDFLTNEKFKPAGGLLAGIEGFHSILTKTTEGIALPIMKKAKDADADSDNSDYDFE